MISYKISMKAIHKYMSTNLKTMTGLLTLKNFSQYSFVVCYDQFVCLISTTITCIMDLRGPSWIHHGFPRNMVPVFLRLGFWNKTSSKKAYMINPEKHDTNPHHGFRTCSEHIRLLQEYDKKFWEEWCFEKLCQRKERIYMLG
jgi:hypothetical protein